MEPFGGVGVLMNLGGKNTEGEILKSLLASSKMQKTEPLEVASGILPDLGPRIQSDKQMVFQIDLGQPVKSEFLSNNNENIIQHIPVTYLTGNNQNIPSASSASNETVVKPLTYLLSRDLLSESPRYCTVGGNEPQNIILLQEIGSNSTQAMYNNIEGKMFPAKESQANECRYQNLWRVNQKDESHIVSESKCDNKINNKVKVINTVKKNIKSQNMECSVGFQAERNEIDSTGSNSNIKVEKKISIEKKPLNKKKNSKLKNKVKTVSLLKKPRMAFEEELEEEEECEMKKKKNLFELTRLEDNVEQVIERLRIGCDCSETNCFEGLDPNDVFKHRLNIADLTKAEHDMFLMGVIMASFHNLEETTRHKERIRIRSYYAYKGKKVCLTAFLYLQHVTLYQMKSLRNHLKNHGVSPKIHGNRGRKPANTFSLEIYRRAANFIQNYVEDHCVKSVSSFTPFFSNRIANNSATGTQFPKGIIKKESKVRIANRTTSYHLPPECTKRIVHGEYKTYHENLRPSQKVMKYSTFTSFLKNQFPNVKFHKRDDKRQEKMLIKSEEAEKWKSKDIKAKIENSEDVGKKFKEELGVDKSVQVDKSLMYIPAKTPVIMNGQRLELHNESGTMQTSYGVANQVLVTGQSFKAHQTHNSEQYYAIDSTV